MEKRSAKGWYAIVVVFVLLNAIFFGGRSVLESWNFDQQVLLAGNLLLLVITLISYALSVRGLNHANPHVFLRSVYLSVMLKLFICIIAAFIYVSVNKASLNKPALFTCMGLYLVYTAVEVSMLMKMLKQNKNA